MSVVSGRRSEQSPQEILDERKERNKEAQRRFRKRTRLALTPPGRTKQIVGSSHEATQRLQLQPYAHSVTVSALQSQSIYTLEGNDLHYSAAFGSNAAAINSNGNKSVETSRDAMPPRHGYVYAMLSNASMMGIALDKFLDCRRTQSELSTTTESASPNLKLSCDCMVKEIASTLSLRRRRQQHNDVDNMRFSEIPTNLHFTPLQRATEHHPSIDTGIAWPSMRDKLMALLIAGLLDVNKLVTDVLIYDEIGGQDAAYNVYGDKTWDAESWEVCENFAKKWPFLLDKNILQTTNKWRRRRGLHTLFLNVGGGTSY